MSEPKKLTEAREVVVTAYRRLAVALATAGLREEELYEALLSTDNARVLLLTDKHLPATAVKIVEHASKTLRAWPEALLEPEEIQFLRHLVRQAVLSAQAPVQGDH